MIICQHPAQDWMLLFFLFWDNLIGVKWYLLDTPTNIFF